MLIDVTLQSSLKYIEQGIEGHNGCQFESDTLTFTSTYATKCL